MAPTWAGPGLFHRIITFENQFIFLKQAQFQNEMKMVANFWTSGKMNWQMYDGKLGKHAVMKCMD